MNIFRKKSGLVPAEDLAAETRLNTIVSRVRVDRPPIAASETPVPEAIQRRFRSPEELQAAGVG